MKNSHYILFLVLPFLFIFDCSVDKNPVEPESGKFIMDSFSPSFVVKNNPEKNITQGFISYDMEYHFKNISGVITTIFINVNHHGVGIDIMPGSPQPTNVLQKSNFSFWIGDSFLEIDSVTTTFHFSGGFWDGKSSYGSFSWDRSFKLPVVRE